MRAGERHLLLLNHLAPGAQRTTARQPSSATRPTRARAPPPTQLGFRTPSGANLGPSPHRRRRPSSPLALSSPPTATSAAMSSGAAAPDPNRRRKIRVTGALSLPSPFSGRARRGARPR